MSNERDILIRALEASGSQREAELAKAILPDAPAPPAAPTDPAATGLTPGQAYEQQRQAAAGVQAAGELPLQSLNEWEELPEREQLARMDELDELLRNGAR